MAGSSSTRQPASLGVRNEEKVVRVFGTCLRKFAPAAGTNFPQLKRVIVISGDKVAMEPTLDEVIQSVFGAQQPQKGAPARSGQPELGHARTQFNEAQKVLQQGDWETFGKAMEALKRLLAGPAQ